MTKPSGVKCAVLHCNSKLRDGARLFKYSTNYSNHELWLKNCGILPFCKKRIFLCSNHFETSCFLKRKLKRTAVPTLFLPEFINTAGSNVQSNNNFPTLQTSSVPSTSIIINKDCLLQEEQMSTEYINLHIESSTQELPEVLQIPQPHFDGPNVKRYSNRHQTEMTLAEIAQLPDPYFDNTLEVSSPECRYCERNEKNIEVYRSLNRKYFLRINKLQNDNTQLRRKIKNLEQRNRMVNKKLEDFKHKPKSCLSDLIAKTKKSEHSKNFCLLLLSERTKTQKWPEHFKSLAQNIYYRSPKAYNFLRERLNFDLPSKTSLLRWQPIKNLAPGTNNISMLKKLKEKIGELDAIGKYCSLIFDEIKIRKDLKYNPIRDCLDGYVDLGDDCREAKIGSYICVFMVRGIVANWKNILCYYVSENAISSNSLAKLIETNLILCTSLDLTVRAVICDQGPNNRKALNNLGANITNPVLTKVSSSEIVGIFDPPHLFKSFRNCILTSDIETSDGVASWEVVRELYKLEQASTTRMCPKLSDKHVNPGHFDKMKVKLSTQVFSRSVVAGIKTVFDLNKFSDSIKHKVPATVVLFDNLDKLFDCLNSKSLYNSNKFKCAIKDDESCCVFKFLNEMLIYIQNIKLVSKKKVYSFDGMIQTINAILFLFKSLSRDNLNFKYLLTSRLNQDALENTFSLIRSANGNNFNPSVQEFSFTVAKLLSIKYITPFTALSNCEDDADETLLNVIREEQQTDQSLRDSEEPQPSSSQNMAIDSNNESDHDDYLTVIVIEEDLEDFNSSVCQIDTNSDPSTRYFTGYLIHRILKKINCAACALMLLKENDYVECPSELLIHHKNYMTDCFGKLQAPSQSFFELCRRQISIFDTFYKSQSHVVGLKFKLKNLILNEQIDKEFYNNNHACYNHRLTLLNLMLTILLRKHCKWQVEQEKLNKIKTCTNRRQWKNILN